MIPKRKFSDLLRIIGNVPGLQRLRFVTSHPRYMSLGVVDAVAETSTACECFHIPFQSGSNEVLAAMGRGHTREKYLHIVNRIRSVSTTCLRMLLFVANTFLIHCPYRRLFLLQMLYSPAALNVACLRIGAASSRRSNYGRCDRRIPWRDRRTVPGNLKSHGRG